MINIKEMSRVSVPLRGITFLNPVPGTLVIKWVSGT